MKVCRHLAGTLLLSTVALSACMAELGPSPLTDTAGLTGSGATGGTAPLGSGGGSGWEAALDSSLPDGLATAPAPISCDIGHLLQGCAASVCHGATRPAGNLNLAYLDPMGDEMAAAVMNVPASYQVADPQSCPSQPEMLLDPNSLENSLLLKKVEGRQSCGSPMPAGNFEEWNAENAPASTQCVREWLANLAWAHAG